MATIALVRSAKSVAGGTPNTCTVVAPAVGNLWVVQVHSTTDSGTPPTCNNSLVQVPSATVLSGSTRRATTFYKIADGSETTSVTATQAGVTSLSVQVYEYSSTTGWPATPYDQVTSQTSSGSSVSTLTALSVTTTSANEVLNVGVALAAYTNPAFTNSFVVEQSDTTNLFSGDLIVTSTGTYSTVPSWTTSRVSCAVMVSFMANAPAGSIDTPRPRRNPERILGVRGPFKPTQPVDALAAVGAIASLSGAGDLSAAGVATPLIPQERPPRNPERIRPFGPFKRTRPVDATATVYGIANLSGSGDLSVDPRFIYLDGTAGAYVSTPDSANVSIASDITVRVDVAMDDWTPASTADLLTKRQTAPQASYAFFLGTDGKPGANTSPDGSTVLGVNDDTATGFADGTTHWVEWTRDVDDGSGNHVDKFYTSSDYNPTDPASGSWTQLGSTITTAGTTSIFDSTSEIEIGSILAGVNHLSAKIFRAQILSGFHGGVVEADLHPSDYVSGSSLTSSATGEVWTFHGAASVVSSVGTVFANASLSGAGDLSATGTIGAPASLTGTGSLSAVPTIGSAAALSGAGDLSAIPTTFGLASLAGAGSLAATITAGPILGTAVLTGTGSLSVRPADPVICYPTHAIGGTSGVTRATGAYDGVTVALGSSTGVTHADDICLHVQASVGGATGVAALSGAGDLSATGAVGSTVFGGAAISGAGSLSATGVPTAFGASALTGAGSLSAIPTIGGVAALSGAGSLSASGTLNRSAALSGAGSLTAIPTTFGVAPLSGAGDLSATLTQSLPDLVPTGIDWT